MVPSQFSLFERHPRECAIPDHRRVKDGQLVPELHSNPREQPVWPDVAG
jgi:hypothetical protein